MSNHGTIVVRIGGLCLAASLLACWGCKQSKPPFRRTKAEEIWYKAEWQDRTNEPAKAYPLILSARDKLAQREVRFPKELNYNFCIGLLNGRLFVLAAALRKTNEAPRFLEDAGQRFNARLRESRIPETNFSAEAIQALVEKWDRGEHGVEGK